MCLAKNSGVFNACSTSYVGEEQASSSTYIDSGECDLSEQLLSAHQHQVDSQVLTLFVLALVIITWLLVTQNQFNPFTEPIVNKTRVHLLLCVFRE